jgi:hypothetical protein
MQRNSFIYGIWTISNVFLFCVIAVVVVIPENVRASSALLIALWINSLFNNQ